MYDQYYRNLILISRLPPIEKFPKTSPGNDDSFFMVVGAKSSIGNDIIGKTMGNIGILMDVDLLLEY